MNDQTSDTNKTPDSAIERHIHSISELNTVGHTLDSHAGKEQYSSLEINQRESYIMTTQELGGISGYYPRIKTLKDGTYIMIFHDFYQGSSIYCATSKDCITWSKPTVVFPRGKTVIDGQTVDVLYMTPDACVLPDGRIICITSYRPEGKYYVNCIGESGVSIKISEDNGKTWSEEQRIYIGTNWEPSLLCADNGEIYAFFTSTAPSLYQLGVENHYYRSSGIAIVRSKDGGKTWTPHVTGAPYLAQYVMRQNTGYVWPNGVTLYTDQMPVAAQLNNGTIVLTAESQLERDGACYMSIAYYDNYFEEELTMTETGPEDRVNNIFSSGGPYIDQFPSGEVVMSYQSMHGKRYRLADCTGRNIFEEEIAIQKSGIWGSCEVVDSHSIVFPVGTGNRETENFRIQVVRAYLNHNIRAGKMTPSMIADTSEWDNNTDALFCGSDAQAQAAVRVGHDDENLYILAERLDKILMSADAMEFYLDSGDESFYRITVGNEGITEIIYKEKPTSGEKTEIDPAEAGIRCYVYVDGTVDDRKDMDNGVIYELAIPKKLLKCDDTFRLCYDLLNSDDQREEAVSDLPKTTINTRVKETWFIAELQ